LAEPLRKALRAVAPLVPHFAEPQRKALRAKAKAKRREVQRAA
jgi:hypothetical protein